MFAKLLMLILCLGMMAGLLLVNRQGLYEVVGERVRLHREKEQLERSVQELKVRVAESTNPGAIDALIGDRRADWRTISAREDLLRGSGGRGPEGSGQR